VGSIGKGERKGGGGGCPKIFRQGSCCHRSIGHLSFAASPPPKKTTPKRGRRKRRGKTGLMPPGGYVAEDLGREDSLIFS